MPTDPKTGDEMILFFQQILDNDLFSTGGITILIFISGLTLSAHLFVLYIITRMTKK